MYIRLYQEWRMKSKEKGGRGLKGSKKDRFLRQIASTNNAIKEIDAAAMPPMDNTTSKGRA